LDPRDGVQFLRPGARFAPRPRAKTLDIIPSDVTSDQQETIQSPGLLVPRMRARLCALLFCGCLLLLGGCATAGDPRDPFEPLNRGIYHFNETVDHVLIKPAAEVYQSVLPQFMRTGVSNFFSNIGDVIIALNNLLQGKVTRAASDIGRIALNTTAGLFGLFDVATPLGLDKNNEDFGQTLGWWGIGNGPFLMLPLLGPSTLRDSVGLVGDWKANPLTYVEPNRDRNTLYGLSFLSRRAELLDATTLLEAAALDPYEFLRDAYLQRRRNLVYDGAPPPDEDFELEYRPRDGDR
jgi:phospholipid-binding lipoprotein MlaA